MQTRKRSALASEAQRELSARNELLSEALREPVAALNRSIEEGLFAQLVQEGKVSFPMPTGYTMPTGYSLVESQWLANGALADFVAKMGKQYQHFDQCEYEHCAEFSSGLNVEPQAYVTRKWRKVRLYEGKVEIKLPLRGRLKFVETRQVEKANPWKKDLEVHDLEVCKWMGASFVLADSGRWDVTFHFLDMADWKSRFCNPEGSLEYARRKLTGGYDVDLEELKEKTDAPPEGA